MGFVTARHDAIGIAPSRATSRRSRTALSASVLALVLACAVQPEPALAQFDVGGMVGGVVGGLMGHRGYGYAPRYGGRRTYAGRRHERHVAHNKGAPSEDKDQGTAPAAVASAPSASTPAPTVAPAAEHPSASGPGNGSLH